MIKLLNGHSLTVKDRFRAEKFKLDLSERQSTATITIGPDAPVISTGDWLQDEDNPGAGIVWRVKSVDTDYAANTRTLNCEHIISTLKDLIMFGEITPGMMAGSGGASVCTAVQAARYVLNWQSDWVLGTFGYSKSAPYNFNSDSLMDALETVSSNLLTPFWTYDTTVYPFRLNITQPSDAVQCEMRTDRNIRTLKRTIDRTRMYTRFYPIGKDNKKLSGNGYVSRNEDVYGLVCHVETDNGLDTDDKLRSWAAEKLQNHAEPLVTVSISGLDLSDATGEPLDRLVLGTVCRVPLPEYNTTITERITKLSWPDKVADNESVTVTLANQVEDVASILNNQNKSSRRSSKNHAKQSEEDHAWMVDTNDHIGLVAEAVAGEGADTDWSRVASVMVDGNGIHQRVTKTEGDIVKQEARIEVTENAIKQEVTERKSEDTTLRGRILVEANKISQVVEAVGKDGQVTAASIVLAINESSGESEAKIDAQRVYIGNQKSTTVINGKCSLSDVTADYIEAKIATLPTLRGISASFSGNVSATGAIMAGGLYIGSGVPYQTVSDAIKQLQIIDNGNNTYTLQKKNFTDSSWVDVATFEHAASTGTTLSGSWSGGIYEVTATPQGNTISTQIRYAAPDGDVSVSGKFVSRQYNIQYGPDDDHLYNTGFKTTISIDATQVYNNGVSSVTVSGSWSGGVFTAQASNNKTASTQLRYLAPNGSVTVSGKSVTRNFAVQYGVDDEHLYNTGYSQNVTIDATDVYNAGHNAVTGSEIILSNTYGGGPGSETTTAPSSNITKANGYFSGYVWLKETGNSYYKNLRAFSFSMPSDATWNRSQYGTSGQYIYSCTVAGKTYTKIY